jgi:hypothetical protein
MATADAGAEPIPDTVWCEEDYWFEIAEPVEWTLDWRLGGESLTLIFDSRRPEAPGVQMKFRLVRASDAAPGSVDLDVNETLRSLVRLANAFGEPGNVEPFEASHPRLPAAGSAVPMGDGMRYLATLDLQNGRGSYFMATLATPLGPARFEEIADFRATLASIEFDPYRGCTQRSGGETVVVALEGPGGLTAPPAAPDWETPPFNLDAASVGCAELGDELVPLYCASVRVDDEPALLVNFEAGKLPAGYYANVNYPRVAQAFCHEAARAGAGAPRLVFYVADGPAAREYDCVSGRLAATVPLESIERE